ncbi:GDSL-type esterase/lipase family protein [Brevibacterium daeguense]|uniref:GDSL-type esterase/lipase family protein n=1 Tax=Brevibacterium daeguense TaxID=909936 RepID=A0ABP8EJC7_9MICO
MLGDELVAGHGDARCLGWVGRVAARTLPTVAAARFYPLGVPQEDSAALARRSMTEADLRFVPEADNRLVLAPGSFDVDAGISTARSRLNLANVLDAALAAEVATFVVGPPPSLNADRNRRIGELNAGFSDVALRRGIGYVDTFAPLQNHAGWMRDLASSADGLPGQEGYGLLAWLVLHRGWFDWLGVPAPATSDSV